MKSLTLRAIRTVHQFFYDTPPPVWGCLGLVGLLATWTQSIPAESELAKQLSSEDGFFEQASVAFLAAASLLCLLSWGVSHLRGWLTAGVVLFYATLRELDFQTTFTYRSVMSTGYYTGAKAPLTEKILVLLVILPCLLAIADLAQLAWRNREIWLTASSGALRSQAAFRAWGAWMLLFFCASHFCDRHPAWLGWLPGRIGTLESLIEAGLCLLAMLLVVETKPRLLKTRGDCEH